MALTEYDFSLFESSAAPVREPARPHPKTKPRREPMRQVRPPREPSAESKQEKARQVWTRTLVSYAIVSAVGLCMFMVIQSQVDYHRATVQKARLETRLSNEQQRNMAYRTQIEHKFSLEVIQDIALNEYHMVPVEGNRVTYLNIMRGDQLLN